MVNPPCLPPFIVKVVITVANIIFAFQGYSKLFYVLQANPQYLANFIFFEFDGVEEMIETIILTLYGYAFSAREEFLLLSFLGSAISREIKNLSDITAFQEGAALLIQMVMAYSR